MMQLPAFDDSSELLRVNGAEPAEQKALESRRAGCYCGD